MVKSRDIALLAIAVFLTAVFFLKEFYTSKEPTEITPASSAGQTVFEVEDPSGNSKVYVLPKKKPEGRSLSSNVTIGDQESSASGGVRSQRQETREDSEYPFQLITGNHLFHSGRLSQKADVLRQLLPESFVEMSDKDALSLGIEDGDLVTIRGQHHEARLKVRVKQGSLKGVAFIAENFEDIPVNLFFKKGEGIPRVKIIK